MTLLQPVIVIVLLLGVLAGGLYETHRLMSSTKDKFTKENHQSHKC